MGFPDDFAFEEPRVTIRWSETFDEVLAKVHQGPVQLDPRTGGRCVVKAATLLGMPLRATFHFDPEGGMRRVRLERGIAETDADSQMPESMAEQVTRHGVAMAKRRKALEAVLGNGVEDSKESPCAMRSARWTSGAIVVEHQVSFNVERGDDEYGYLADSIELSRSS